MCVSVKDIKKMQEYKVEIDNDGTEFWLNKDDVLHRENDKPAVIFADGTKLWIRNGKLHRDNGPAITYPDSMCASVEDIKNMQEYTVKIDNNGTERWYNKDEKLHRDDDEPAAIYYDGTKYWYKNGKLHRENGPAAIFASGYEEYWVNGVLQPDPKY
jgi:outer membrane lipoprotein-sorting protein